MSRDLDPLMAAALSSGFIMPIFAAMLTFRTATKYVWTGSGNLVFNAQTFVGIGSLGKIGIIQEGADVQADGTSVGLSGIDPALLNECMTDIQIGAPVTIWFGLMTPAGGLIGTPYKLFAGNVDKPVVSPQPDTISIALALENRMVDLSRAGMRRYTSADQRLYFPTDTSMGWIEQLNDLAIIWGQ